MVDYSDGMIKTPIVIDNVSTLMMGDSDKSFQGFKDDSFG